MIKRFLCIEYSDRHMAQTIPPHARCVYKGILCKVYTWEQKLFDGSVTQFERIVREDSVQVIPILNNTIVVAHEQQPNASFTGLIGGRCEPGEDALSAAKRELAEESGLVSDHWEKIAVWQPDGMMIWSIHLYIARNCYQKTQPHLDPGERITLEYLDIDAFCQTAISKGFRARSVLFEVFGVEVVTALRNALVKQ